MDIEELESDFVTFCEEIGIMPDELMNIFMNKVVREQRVPFELALSCRPAPQDPMQYMRDISVDDYIIMFKNESIQTIALILSLIDNPVTVGKIIVKLPDYQQADVTATLAKGFSLSDDMRLAIAKDFAKRTATRMTVLLKDSDGVSFVNEALRQMSFREENSILDRIEETDKDLYFELSQNLIRFDDILFMADVDIQKLLREVDSIELARALKSADDEVQQKIYRNMSPRASTMLKEDIDYIGPMSRKDSHEAQLKIVSIIRRMEEAGDIVIVRPGDDEII